MSLVLGLEPFQKLVVGGGQKAFESSSLVQTKMEEIQSKSYDKDIFRPQHMRGFKRLQLVPRSINPQRLLLMGVCMPRLKKRSMRK